MRIFVAIDGSEHGTVVLQASATLLRHAAQPDIKLATIIDASEARVTAAHSPDMEIPRGSGWAGTGGVFITQAPGARTVEDRAQAFARLRDETQHRLSRLADEHLAPHRAAIHVEVAEDAARAITAAAERHGAELIVLGTHGRTGLRRMVLGSIAQSVVHHAAAPAVLIREPVTTPEARDAPLSVILPTDGTRRVLQALPAAGKLLGDLGATVTVARVLELPTLVVQSTLQAQRRAIQRELDEHIGALAGVGVEADGVILEGYPVRSLINFARERGAELLLVPTHDRSEAGRVVLGSVADRLIHEAPCPVALVRARGT
jgi:nucleotide-binding universal stress UspA family protein